MTSIFETKLGWIGIEGNSKGLTHLMLPHRCKGEIVKLLGRDRETFHAENLMKCVRKDLIGYLDGLRICFDYPVDLRTLSPFVVKVLEIVSTVPYGKAVSYLWVAEKIGGRQFARAVGLALSKNPLPIIIPCHRVIKSDGGIGGFTGGIFLKKKFHKIEGISIEGSEPGANG